MYGVYQMLNNFQVLAKHINEVNKVISDNNGFWNFLVGCGVVRMRVSSSRGMLMCTMVTLITALSTPSTMCEVSPFCKKLGLEL